MGESTPESIPYTDADKHMHRLAMLTASLVRWDSVFKKALSGDSLAHGLQIRVGYISGDDVCIGHATGTALVDLVTAARIVTAAKSIIVEELSKLGVQADG